MTVSVVSHVPATDEAPGEGPIFVCPCLLGFPDALALRMAILPVHDANAWLDAPEAPSVPPNLRNRIYFGVFALDRLRSRGRILARLQAKGIPGVVNLPSVSFFDGQTGETLSSLGFGLAEELDFLQAAKNAGMRTALCSRRGGKPAESTVEAVNVRVWHDIATGTLVVADP